MNSRRILVSAVLLRLVLAVACTQPPHARAEDWVWESDPGFRRARLAPPSSGKPGFTLVPAALMGIDFTNLLSEAKISQFQNTMNGSGLVAGDYDNDGWCDLFFCNKEGPCALYRNLGNGSFSNVTASAGVGCANQLSSGALFADLNGDGFLDLFVTSFGGPNTCLLNNGHGAFTDFTKEAGLVSAAGSTSVAAADLDGDGDLDLYLCNFGIVAILRDGGQISTRMVNGKPIVTGRYANRVKIIDGFLVEFGEPDVLYWNDGKAHFTAATWADTFTNEEGKPVVAAPPDFGLAVQIRDINGDGYPDIYVCNDFQTPDRLWLNDGKGRFHALERLALRNMSNASMGVDFADIDRDGRLDFITVEMLSRNHAHYLQQSSPLRPVVRLPGKNAAPEDMARNALYWNRGDGTYAEIGYFAGVSASDWSWTPIFLDVDLDGYEDLLISNGHMHDVNFRDISEAAKADPSRTLLETRKNLERYPKLEPPKCAFRNRGNLTFEDVSDRWGFNSTRIAHGACLLDLDHDGDLDVVMNAANSEPLIYRNNAAAPRLCVRLKGANQNARGIGARISLSGRNLLTQTQEMLCGGRYLSGDDAVRTFATGALAEGLQISVIWRSGRRSVVENASPGFVYEVDEAGAVAEGVLKTVSIAQGSTWFEDASARVGHQHQESLFDDFAVQPLLPRRMSQLGPGVICTDLTGDGHDDLAIGSGQGGTIAVLVGDGRGGFSPVFTNGPVMADDSQGMVTGTGPDGSSVLLVSVANYQARDAARSAVMSLSLGKPISPSSSTISTLARGASPGALALADIDGDGDLDLFVGGRFLAARYPEPVASAIYRNDSGQFVLDVRNERVMKGLGMVTGALWTDLDNDGYPELVVGCDWGPVRVFHNDHGTLLEITHELQLDRYTGWWSGVAAGDFDGDGRIDLVVGNWGLNGRERVWAPLPYHVYFGDFSEAKSVQVIEAFFDISLNKIVPMRDLALLRTAIPELRDRIPNHEAYAKMSVAEILGSSASHAAELEVNTLDSMVFLNRGKHFDAQPLPREAQWAPVFGVSVADFNGDGAEDVFLAQNCFTVRGEDTRLDSGRSQMLRGDGKGGFASVAGQVSGLIVYGEQRGSAVGDVNEDGRTDLVVTENGGPTHLFLNRIARPGLRIRLEGPAQNPRGIGATVRLRSGDHFGPARELHAGSGYWSQDSSVMVMSLEEIPSSVWVRWPGGRENSTAVTLGAREIVVKYSAP